MHSGTLNLNGDTLLLNSGTSTFGGGTVTNGLLQLRGTEMTFNSTTFNAPIDAVVDRINLNGCTFNNYCYFETVTNVPGTGSGGAVFNDSVYLYHNYTGSGIWVMNNNTGHRFNGKVTIHNKGTKEITFGGAGINVFNGDIVLINTGAGGIMLGNDTLTAGHTISIGSGGFSAGDFNATNFYQDGNTAVSLTFTGSALPSITGATFGGNFSITSNVLLFKNCTFSGTASFTATGSGSSSWYGGNIFYGNATFTNNASAGNLRLDTDTSNTYYADATFGGSRELRVCYGGDVSSFYGNITTASNTTFNAGTGTLCLAGSSNQTLSFGGSNFVKNLMLNKSGGSASLATALAVSGTVTFVKGTLTTTSSNLLTINNGGTVSGASDSSFIDGPVKKIGNSAFVFPTGKGNSCRAIEISAPSNTTDAFTGEYFNTGQVLGSNKDTTIKQLNNCDYWALSRNVGSSNITVTLFWNKQTCLITSLSSMRVCNWNGTIWIDKGNAGYTGSAMAGSITASLNNNTYSYFTLGNNTVTYTGLPAFDIAKGFALLSGGNIVLNTSLYAFGKTGSMGITSNLLMASDSIIQNGQNPLDTAIIEVANAIAYINGLSAASISDSIYDQILTPGVYEFENDAYLGGKIHFTGDTNAVYIFKAKGNLTITPQTYFETDSVKLSRIIWACNKNFLSDTMTNFRGIVLAKGIINFKTDNFGYSMSATLSDIDLFHNSNANRFPYSRSIFELENLNLNLLPCNTSIYPCKNLLPNGSFEDGPIPQTGGQFVTNVNCWSVGIRGAYDITGTIFCRQSNGLTPDIYDQFALCTSGCGLNCSNTSGAFPDVRIPTNTYTTNTFCHSSNNYRYMALSMDEAANTTLISALDHTTYLLSYWVKPSDCFTMSNINNYRLCVNIFNFGSPAKQYNIASHNFAGLPANDWTRLYECVDLTNTSYDLAGIDRLGFALQSSSLPDDKMFFDDFYLIKVADAGLDVVACSTATIGSLCQFDPAIFEVTFNWTGPGGFSSTDANPVVTTSGTYTLEVTIFDPITHQYICDGMDEVNVSLTGTGLSVSIASSAIVCNGQSNGSLTALPSGATYQWSNSATTQTITNLNAGTYTVTVTQNGCTGSTSATLTNPPILTVSVSKTNVSCQGGNDGTATATPSGGVTPYTYQWSSGGAATSQTNTGLTTGTYTVTVTDANGCTAVGSVTIPFNSALPPTPQITGNGVAACMTTNSYSVTNILSGGTYSWTASPVATGPSSGSGSTASNIDWNDFTSGSITFTVTATSGCQNSATFNIYPCCDNVNDNVINTSVTEMITAVTGNPSAYDYFTYDAMSDIAEINTGGTFGSNTFVINGTFTVNHDLHISNSNVSLGPDAEIIIEDGYSLYIDTDDPSYLHACGSYMWKQITINPGGYLYALNSYFEDAKTAVVSENNSTSSKEGGYWLTGNTFNRNYVSLYVSPYNKSHKGYLNVNYFKCATTTTGTTQGTITIDPHIGQTSLSGLDVDNVTGDITIGGWGFGSYTYLSSNIFDGLCYGMRAYYSNLYIGNNIFMNMRNYNGLNSAGAGAGVFLDGLGMTNGPNAFIGLYDPGMGWTNNLFKENLYGVLATGNYNLNFTYTDFEATNNYGTGIWYARATNATLNVTDDIFSSGLPNTFMGLKTGVVVINCRNSSINIKKNIFSNSSVSNTGYSAIRLRNVAIPFQNMPNVTTVSGNQIDLDYGTGIELTRYNNALIGGTDPNIININGIPSGAASYGIRIANSAANDLWGNHIEGPNTLPLASVDKLLFGVLVQTPSAAASGNSANIITENNIIKTGTGIGFLTTNIPQTVKCNNLDQNWSGVRLVGSSIGDQMPSGRDQNNTWNQQPGPSAARAIVSSPPIIPKPIWYSGNSTVLTPTEMTPYGCMDFQSATIGADCDPSVLRAQQQLLTDVAAQEGYYDSLDADMQYWAQRQVYELLLSDDSLMLQGTAADTLLALWKDSVATGNIGAFRTVADSAIANAAYAAELNYNITPLNHAEENEQAVYALYFALAGEQPDSAQHETLSAIAAENAISGGGGVYMARAMIDTSADDVTGIASLRMIAPKQTDIKHSGKLYPNPANTVVYYENVLGEDENGKIKLMDMLGKEIKEYKLTKGSNLISIPVSELSKGIYMVKVEITERNSEIIKLVVN